MVGRRELAEAQGLLLFKAVLPHHAPKECSLGLLCLLAAPLRVGSGRGSDLDPDRGAMAPLASAIWRSSS